jgi:hypothetical protein
MPENVDDQGGHGDCAWEPGRKCQFPQLSGTVSEFRGRRYCIVHRPFEAHTEKSTAQAQEQIHAYCKDMENFDGVIFPIGNYEFQKQSVSLKSCTFAGGTKLRMQDGSVKGTVDLSGSKFERTALLAFKAAKTLVARNCTFADDIAINIGQGLALGSADFSGTRFVCRLILNAPVGSELLFTSCEFSRAPEIGPSDLPKHVSFTLAVFNRGAFTARDEPRYRHVRNLFHKQRARDVEGRFYAYEKRCQRLGTPWWPVGYGISRCLSRLYDASSEYGQSYERALGAFLLLQVYSGSPSVSGTPTERLALAADARDKFSGSNGGSKSNHQPIRPGRSSSFGTYRSQVQILSPRPLISLKFFVAPTAYGSRKKR